MAEPETPGGGHLVQKQRGDQEPGDDEEDVNPDEAATDPRDTEVREDHQCYRDGTQSLHVGAPPQRRGRERCVHDFHGSVLAGVDLAPRCLHPAAEGLWTA